MAFYIKVTKEVADRLNLTDIRNKTTDGNVLLWQADVLHIAGDTIFDRAASVGGVCLSPQEAKAEIDGNDHPVQVSTPDKYKSEASVSEVKTSKEEVSNE